MSKPHPLGDREIYLINLYSQWEFSMTPQGFYTKWAVSYEQIALICHRSDSTVRAWFKQGSLQRKPQFNDLRHLAIMDFLLEHFEQIPESFSQILYKKHIIN